jgi:putative membrane protein
MNWVMRTLVLALGIYVVSYGFGLIEAENSVAVLIGGLILAGLNVFLRPVLLILTLPLNLVTLGLFTLILNAIVLGLAVFLTPGLYSAGFGKMILAALVVSVISLLVNSLVGRDARLS